MEGLHDRIFGQIATCPHVFWVKAPSLDRGSQENILATYQYNTLCRHLDSKCILAKNSMVEPLLNFLRKPEPHMYFCLSFPSLLFFSKVFCLLYFYKLFSWEVSEWGQWISCQVLEHKLTFLTLLFWQVFKPCKYNNVLETLTILILISTHALISSHLYFYSQTFNFLEMRLLNNSWQVIKSWMLYPW